LRSSARGFIHSLEFKHRLRVCNAYPYNTAIDIYRGKTEEKNRLTADRPMHYKACRDFEAPLMAGDKLEFKVGDASAGTFAVSDLPNNDAVLLLVILRHDRESTAVSFNSHVYANLQNAQVAVLDTYKGVAPSKVQIHSGKNHEELRYDSVIALNQGTYEVELESKGATVAKSNFTAVNKENYVMMRVGVEAKQGPSYPQELVIYPNTFHGSARLCSASMTLFAIALAMVRWW